MDNQPAGSRKPDNQPIGNRKPDNRPIGVFDSGLGGLTAVKELEKILPRESIVYFGDTGRVPYGTRSRETIRRYAAQDMAFLMNHDVKAVLAACGTVSSTAGDIGRNLPVPYFDVIGPSAKAAAGLTKNKKVGVIGTSATIHSDAYRQALLGIDYKLEVYSQACPLFVPLVENAFISPQEEVTRLHPLSHHCPHHRQRNGPFRVPGGRGPGSRPGPSRAAGRGRPSLRGGKPPQRRFFCHRRAGKLYRRGRAVLRALCPGPHRTGEHGRRLTICLIKAYSHEARAHAPSPQHSFVV